MIHDLIEEFQDHKSNANKKESTHTIPDDYEDLELVYLFSNFSFKTKKKLITNKKEDKNVNLIIFNKKGITTLIAKTRKKTKLS